MSSMQNYLASRSPCGNQRCDDKPSDGSILGKGRSTDKSEFKRELRQEEQALIDPYDLKDHIPGYEEDWFDYEAPYKTQTRYY